MLLLNDNAVVDAAYRLPPLPQSALRLTALVASAEPDLREIAQVIEYDPTLTMKLLRVANSAVSASTRRIGTIQQALIRLGTGIVAGFAVASCVRPLVTTRIPGYNVSETEFWNHSLAAAFAAESIEAYCSLKAGPLVFTAGLLHDIGKLVLGQFLDAEMAAWLQRAVAEAKQPAYLAEKEILSMHHGEVGGIIAQHWGLPDSLTKGIIYHHDPIEGSETVCFVTCLANLVSHRLAAEQHGDSANAPTSRTDEIGDVLTSLRLGENDLRNVCTNARKRMQSVVGQTV